MSLKAVLLITLKDEPASGYDVLKRFQKGLAHVWNASHQQIYRELERMYQLGLVERETVPQQGRPNRKVYRITSEGETELQQWLESPLDPPVVRLPLYAKFFAWESWPAEARERELSGLRQQLEERLATYRAIEQYWFSSPWSMPAEKRAPWHTLRLGQRLTETWIEWIDEVTEQEGSTS